jgi:hypothetical protein
MKLTTPNRRGFLYLTRETEENYETYQSEWAVFRRNSNQAPDEMPLGRPI